MAASDAANAIVASLGWSPIGDSQYSTGNKTFTNLAQYVVYAGQAYKAIAVPYTTDIITYPNAADDTANLIPVTEYLAIIDGVLATAGIPKSGVFATTEEFVAAMRVINSTFTTIAGTNVLTEDLTASSVTTDQLIASVSVDTPFVDFSGDSAVAGVDGRLRYNNALQRYEGYKNGNYSSLGGATGGGSDQAFYENDSVITADYTITTGKNAMTVGPVTIASGVTVTIPTGSVWAIIGG
jgi:hypothetical protein